MNTYAGRGLGLLLLSLLLLQQQFLHRAAASSNGKKQVKGFDADVAQYFLSSPKKQQALEYSTLHRKPLLVMVTRAACPDSARLKAAVNEGSAVKELLAGGRFAVVHAEDQEANEWQAPYQGYSPQVTFWAPGVSERPMPINGPDPTGKPYFIVTESDLLWALQNVLWANDGGPRPVRKDKDEL